MRRNEDVFDDIIVRCIDLAVPMVGPETQGIRWMSLDPPSQPTDKITRLDKSRYLLSPTNSRFAFHQIAAFIYWHPDIHPAFSQFVGRAINLGSHPFMLGLLPSFVADLFAEAMLLVNGLCTLERNNENKETATMHDKVKKLFIGDISKDPRSSEKIQLFLWEFYKNKRYMIPNEYIHAIKEVERQGRKIGTREDGSEWEFKGLLMDFPRSSNALKRLK